MRYNFTPQAQFALQCAKDAAREMRNSFIGTEHLLLGLLKVEGCTLANYLVAKQISYITMKEDIIVLFGFADETILKAEYTQTMEEILKECVNSATKSNKNIIDVDLLTLTLLEASNNVAVELLRRYDIDVQAIIDFIKKEDIHNLDKFSELRNLNELMKNRESNIVSREAQLNLMMSILCRKEKANPLLLGEPGVGKTAIVEQLAKKIVEGDVHEYLRNVVIYELNINSLVAGTKYRGEFEEKVQKIIEALHQFPQVILFIDEIHQMVGAGKAEGSIDVAGVLKPYLARGQIRCIGSTTYDEYLRFIEKDRALERRFQPIMVEEPNFKEACLMVEAKATEYQKHHHVEFNHQLIPNLVRATQYYLPQRKLPDKAIDVLDLACVEAKMNHRLTVAESDINLVLQQLTNIPLTNHNRLTSLIHHLEHTLIGQQMNIEKIQRQIQWLDLGLVEEKPLASWLFAGENQQAKDQVIKILNQDYFNQPDRCIRVDMLEFHDSSANYRFMHGMNQERAGWINKLKRFPYGIIVFENIDGAHPDCISTLKKLVRQGVIEDDYFDKIDLRHSLVILTTQSTIHPHTIGFHQLIDNELNPNEQGMTEIVDETFVFEPLNNIQLQELTKQKWKSWCDSLSSNPELSNDLSFLADLEINQEDEIDKKIKEKLSFLLIRSS